MKIVVAHPTKQYINPALNQLEEQGWLQRFFTTFAANKWNAWTQKLPPQLQKELKKRHFKFADHQLIEHFPAIFLKEKLLRPSYFSKIKNLYSQFDHKVANKLSTLDYDLVIGYENSNFHTFKKAKAEKKITVLDLAQVHHHLIEEINQIVPIEMFDGTQKAYINQRKEEALKYTDYILTLSSFAKASLCQNGIAEDHIYEVNLGIDPSNFTLKAQYNSQDKFTFLFVGTLCRRKGIEILFHAFNSLKWKDQAQLLLVGPVADDAIPFLEKFKGTYTHIPFVHQEALTQYYQKADVFVFPSLLDSWAQTVVEAMACGTPVIVTEHTGSKDAVKKGGGFVIPINNTEALMEKMTLFYEGQTLAEKLGKKAHLIAQQYTWANYKKQLTAALSDIKLKEKL